MQKTQVLVIGGSLVGLSGALFLAARGVHAITIERHAGSSLHPRAIGYTPRTMEIFRSVGLGDAIPQVPANFRLRRARVISLAGIRLDESDWTPSDLRGADAGRPSKAAIDPTVPELSPVRGAVIAQDLLEPILRDKARELGADIRQSVELISFQQDVDGVSARTRNRLNGEETCIRAQYMIAADGGNSPIREALNITRTGRGHMRYVRSVLFRADLTQYLSDGLLQWEIEQPNLKAFLTTYQDGRWVLMFLDDVERDEEAIGVAIRQAIGRDDIAFDVVTTGRWDLSALVADRFSSGRVFLAGDAAHQLPPTRGGYGANTGIADVHNLAWKLKEVLIKSSSPALLDTYDAERRPVAWLRHQQIFARPDYASDAQGWGHNEPIIDDDAMELGQLYRSTAVIGAGAELPLARRPEQWAGQPGTRAPHFLVDAKCGAVSFLDLLQKGWLLVAADSAWQAVVQKTTLGGKPVDLAIIGTDFVPQAGVDVSVLLGIGKAGASLIRPDGYIAWRTNKSGDAALLADALQKAASAVLRFADDHAGCRGKSTGDGLFHA